jgi:hypothetical protein
VPDLKTLTHVDFEECLDQEFRLRVDETRIIDLTLRRVDARGPVGSESGRRRPFSLVFEAQPGPVVPQRMYQVEHAAMGRLDLFLVPIGREAEAVLYEAVFS